MQRVVVRKNSTGEIGWTAEMDDPTAWIADQVSKKAWGEPGKYTVEVIDLESDLEWKCEQCRLNRKNEYPTEAECSEALLEMLMENRPEKIAQLQAVRVAVKNKYPMPEA
jgi:hypothetical protein